MTKRDQSTRQMLELRSGAVLCYASYGAPDGKPVFHFHGHPGSRLEGKLADAPAAALGVHLICIDRPGMGYSTFQRSRRLLDWPEYVIELADALGIDRFAVQGASGGGPYALACAFKIPDRISGCGILAGLGPIDVFGTGGMMPVNRLQFGVSRALPMLLRPLFAITLARYRRYLNDDAGLESAATALAARRPELPPATATAYLRETVEAFRQGSQGAAYDAFLFARPWDFALEDIACPVDLWHGESDRHVPIEMARGVAASIPGCRARFIEGQDHMTTILSCVAESLSVLTSQ